MVGVEVSLGWYLPFSHTEPWSLLLEEHFSDSKWWRCSATEIVCVCTAFLSWHYFLKRILILVSKDRYFSSNSCIAVSMFLPADGEQLKKVKWPDDHSSLWKMTFSEFFRISKFIFPVLNPSSAYLIKFCWLDSVCRKWCLEGDFLSHRNLWGKADEWAEMFKLPSRTAVTLSVPGRAWWFPAFPAECHCGNLLHMDEKALRLLWALRSVIYPFVYIKLTIATAKWEEKFGSSTFAVNSFILSGLVPKSFFWSCILKTLQVTHQRRSDGYVFI